MRKNCDGLRLTRFLLDLEFRMLSLYRIIVSVTAVILSPIYFPMLKNFYEKSMSDELDKEKRLSVYSKSLLVFRSSFFLIYKPATRVPHVTFTKNITPQQYNIIFIILHSSI